MEQLRAIKLGDNMIKVDIKLAPLIQGLFRAGITTLMSCQEAQPGISTLMFLGIEDAHNFILNASDVLEYFIWDHECIVYPGYGLGAVSIRFPLADIHRLKRLFPVG
jgi:hypothetical protein